MFALLEEERGLENLGVESILLYTNFFICKLLYMFCLSCVWICVENIFK